MSDLIQWLRDDSTIAVLLSVALLVVIVVFAVLIVVAFVQGRSITLWPPGVGPKPSKDKRGDLGDALDQGIEGEVPCVGTIVGS